MIKLKANTTCIQHNQVLSNHSKCVHRDNFIQTQHAFSVLKLKDNMIKPDSDRPHSTCWNCNETQEALNMLKPQKNIKQHPKNAVTIIKIWFSCMCLFLICSSKVSFPCFSDSSILSLFLSIMLLVAQLRFCQSCLWYCKSSQRLFSLCTAQRYAPPNFIYLLNMDETCFHFRSNNTFSCQNLNSLAQMLKTNLSSCVFCCNSTTHHYEKWIPHWNVLFSSTNI